MSDCGCEKAKQALEDYLHNELCSEDAADIREHMENCTGCSDEHKVGVVLTEAGKREVDNALTDLLERERVILAALPRREQASLATALRTLVTEFDA